MQQALLVRLRPSGPWRYGPSDGALDRVDTIYRSDRLFSAITIAMRQLGHLDAWLDATARHAKPAVAFTSLFPFQGETLYVMPPASLWPPPSSLVTSPSPVFLNKVRWRAAHFVPLSLVDSLLTGQSVLADQWIPDPESGCLLRRDRPSSSPFRTVARTFSPVDRLRLTAADAETSACVEFESGAGLWTAVRFADDTAQQTWNVPLRAAFRLLADSGFGGGRSRGWGQVQAIDVESGTWPALILPKVGRYAKNDVHEEQTSRSYWLLSLYSPSTNDSVNWSGGQYELAVRNGRVDGASGALKKSARMVLEGCVLEAASEPVGTAVDVTPEGFAHPVYRSGIAVALLIPPPKPQSEDRRAIEEIVPPELEATPFPMPEPPAIKAPEQTEEEPAATPEALLADALPTSESAIPYEPELELPEEPAHESIKDVSAEHPEQPIEYEPQLGFPEELTSEELTMDPAEMSSASESAVESIAALEPVNDKPVTQEPAEPTASSGQPMESAAAYEPPIEEPEPDPGHELPLEEPERESDPLEDPDEEPGHAPMEEPENDLPPIEATHDEPVDPHEPHKEPGHEI